MSERHHQPVGVIGLGIMGSAMSKNLLEAGFRVVGYDIAASGLDALVERGGEATQSVTEVATKADILITSLPSAAAFRDVVAELTNAPRANRVLAETSTFSLDEKLNAEKALHEAGIVMLDCPISGSGSQALVRDVLVYGSGPRTHTIVVCQYFRDFRARRTIWDRLGTGPR